MIKGEYVSRNEGKLYEATAVAIDRLVAAKGGSWGSWEQRDKPQIQGNVVTLRYHGSDQENISDFIRDVAGGAANISNPETGVYVIRLNGSVIEHVTTQLLQSNSQAQYSGTSIFDPQNKRDRDMAETLINTSLASDGIDTTRLAGRKNVPSKAREAEGVGLSYGTRFALASSAAALVVSGATVGAIALTSGGSALPPCPPTGALPSAPTNTTDTYPPDPLQAVGQNLNNTFTSVAACLDGPQPPSPAPAPPPPAVQPVSPTTIPGGTSSTNTHTYTIPITTGTPRGGHSGGRG